MSTYKLSDVTVLNGENIVQINNADSVLGAVQGSLVQIGNEQIVFLDSVDIDTSQITLTAPWPYADAINAECTIAPITAVSALLSSIAKTKELLEKTEQLTSISAMYNYSSLASLKDACANGKVLPGNTASTDGYYEGTVIGGGLYLLKDVTTSAARPPEDGGRYIHIGTEGLYLVSISKSVDVFQFGALGNGTALDTQVLKSALVPVFGTSNQTFILDLGQYEDAVFLVDETIIEVDSVGLIIKGRGTIKRAENMIVNVDGDSSNFSPLIRIQGAPNVELSGSWKIDGNRDGQVYPETDNTIGRGSKPWRHNAEIEITPDISNTNRSKSIRIDFGGVENSYLNGLALWQVEDAKVSGGTFKNTTWNGITGAGVTDVSITGERCYFYRCASYDAFDTNRVQGDRAGIQFREFAIGFTAETEGLPTISSGEFAEGGINSGITIIGASFKECSVESIYIRAGFDCTVSHNKSYDCGYKRLYSSGRYYPAHIWLESGQYTCCHNNLIQTKVEAGDMQPDGLRITTLAGDATELYPANGFYHSTVNHNTIRSDVDPHTAVSHQYFHYGVRCNGSGNFDDNVIDGCSDWPFWVQNGDSHPGETVPQNFSANNCTFINVPESKGAVIYISKYGTVGGDVKNISAKSCNVPSGLSVLRFNSNLSDAAKINISHGIGDIFSRYTDTDQIALTAALKAQVSHGLGEFPKLVEPLLVCLSSQGGWQTGDHVPVKSLLSDGSMSSGVSGIGISTGYDGVNLTVIVGKDLTPLKLLNRSNPSAPENIGESFNLDLTKWALLVRAFV